MDEKWVTVANHPGYQVSDQGRVRSVDRVVSTRKGTDARIKGRVLKPWRGSSGYLQVYVEGRRTKLVHHLVLESFVGPRPEGLEARHLNGDQLDNRRVNLAWATHSVNNRDKSKHGTDHQRNKTHCPRGHELKVPNLVPGRLKQGTRVCHSCALEVYSARDQGRAFDPERANDRYKSIMRDANHD